jgi:integrase
MSSSSQSKRKSERKQQQPHINATSSNQISSFSSSSYPSSSSASASATVTSPSLSSLRDSALKPATTCRYKRALHLFLYYCIDSDNDVELDNMDGLDLVVSEYIEHLHLTSQSKTLASNTINAINFYLPRSKHHLHESRLLIRGWNNLEPKHSRPPLTLELSVVIAISMLKGGYYDAAVATLLAFDCYLRIGELTNIRVCDVALRGNLHFGNAYTGAAIGLPNTKTGPNQFVTVSLPIVEQLLQHHVDSLLCVSNTKSQSLFNLSKEQYRKIFYMARDQLGLSKYLFTPHSLRHGAATCDYMKGKTVEDILLRGRWRQALSARIYIQSGQMLLISVDEPRLQQLGANIVLDSTKLMDLFTLYRPSIFRSSSSTSITSSSSSSQQC